MTEYDYSPDAVERYMATQSRVSNWVSHQSSEAPKYSNPFQYSPSEAADKSRVEFYAQPERSGRSRSHSSSETARPTPRRSHTDHGHGHRSHRSHRDQSSSSSKPLSGTESSTTATTTTKRHHTSRSQTTPVYYPTTVTQTFPTPIRSQSMPIANGHPIVLPQAKPGQTYVLIPNHRKGTDGVVSTILLAFCSPTNSRSRHHRRPKRQ
jgi:hypothetical protein